MRRSRGIDGKTPRLASPASRPAIPVGLVPLVVLAGCLSGLAVACKSPAGTTGARLRITSKDRGPLPSALEGDWFDSANILLRFYAPEGGEFKSPRSSATITIEVDPAAVGQRRVIVRGLVGGAGGAVVSEGAARLELIAGAWVDVEVTLMEGRLEDRDWDGIPDIIDDCPLDSGPCMPLTPGTGGASGAGAGAGATGGNGGGPGNSNGGTAGRGTGGTASDGDGAGGDDGKGDAAREMGGA